MNAIIIDDEKRARLTMQLLLEEYCPEVTILADCESLPQGVKAIRKLKPDLIFLDIEMPDHSGLELLDFFDVDQINFDIIFTTAYDQFAIKAFGLAAVDYLLKPVNPELLQKAVKRVLKNQQKNNSAQVEQIPTDKINKIAIPTGNSLQFLELHNIVYLKGDGAYSEIHTRQNEKLVASRNLKNFEDLLCDSSQFVRVHKSYIVNVNCIVAYNKSDGGSLQLLKNINIPISADRVSHILENIKMLKK